jgi:hypothetical protein
LASLFLRPRDESGQRQQRQEHSPLVLIPRETKTGRWRHKLIEASKELYSLLAAAGQASRSFVNHWAPDATTVE